MTIVPWPEWLPDQADFQNPGTSRLRNVVPLTTRSYGPMPSIIPVGTNTLAERCQGAYSLKGRDGETYIFAGDRQHLYVMVPGSLNFDDVSRAVGGPYDTLSPTLGGHWHMTSYGTRVIATNLDDPIQSFPIPPGAGAKFGDLSSEAPRAKFAAVVKDFLFVANTFDPVDGNRPNRVWWSAINDPTNWPVPGSTEAIQLQSDYQDLQQTDLGVITGLVSGFAPGADVIIFCERGLYIGAYIGPPLIFSFRVAQGASGTISPLSIVQSHARTEQGTLQPACYYLSEQGFTAFDGLTAHPVGAQKFDREFFRMVDPTYISLVQAAADPRTRAVLWAFPNVGSQTLHSRIFVYNWELSRASPVMLPEASYVEWLTTAMYGESYNLDTIDLFGNLDVIQPPFDDPFWTGNAISRLTPFDRNHRLNIGGGPAMAPLLETGEIQPAEGRRAWVTMARPLFDGGSGVLISVGTRERLNDPVVWSEPVPINQIGECPQRATGRYMRFRMTMPEAQDFRHLQGLDIRVQPEATLR
jgi:hypothetical protein